MEIVLGKSIGPVELEMSREGVHALMGEPLPDSGAEKEYYCGNAFQVCFDEHDRVEFVEAAQTDEFSVTLHGVPLLEIDASEAIRIVSSLGPCDLRDAEYPYSCVFPSLGLCLWRECLPEDDPEGRAGRQFDTVAVGTTQYFECCPKK